jgi:hypothetical protein
MRLSQRSQFAQGEAIMQNITSLREFLTAVALLFGMATLSHAQNVNCDGCVNTGDIANDAVTAAKIKEGAIRPKHLGLGAKPAGAEFSDPVGVNAVLAADTVITSVTLNLPGPGVVVVNSGGYAEFDATPSVLRCSITTLSVITIPQVAAEGQNIPNARRMPIATTRGFRETSGGTKTYNLVCRTVLGTVELNDVILTAVFAPRRY